MSNPEPPPKARPKGFATMTYEQIRRIASRGGRAVPAEKRTFSRDRDTAVRAGRLGGSAPRVRRTPGDAA